MKVAMMPVLAMLALLATVCSADTSPVSKVLEMLDDMKAKEVAEGEKSKEAQVKKVKWCELRNAALDHEIKTGKSEVDELNAEIKKQQSTQATLATKMEGLTQKIESNEADVKEATAEREKETADFRTDEKELMETIDQLGRAIRVLEQKSQTGGDALVQTTSIRSVVAALQEMVHASSLNLEDAKHLTALVQRSKDGEEDSDGEFGAPAAPAYESHGAGVLDMLEDLLEKAETQLADLRKKEATDDHNFKMTKQSLEDEISFANKELSEAKKASSASSEAQSNANGDLGVTSGDLAEDERSKEEVVRDCAESAEDFKTESKEREEELEALGKAHEIIASTTSKAAGQSYGFEQMSLLQLSSNSMSRITSRSGLVGFEVVRSLRELASRDPSAPALAQLAAHASTALRLGAVSGEDPLAKIVNMVQSNIESLEKELAKAASQKEFCDRETSEANAKKDEKDSAIDDLTTKLNKMSSHSAELKEEVSALQESLSELSQAQGDMDKLRQKEHSNFLKRAPEMQQGIEGVQMALKVIKDYYSKSDKGDAANGIVGMLEVVESDFSKGLAEMKVAEESAQSAYEKETNENKLEKATKEKDVEYKTKEITSLEKASAEKTSDREAVQTELEAVLDSLKSLAEQCVAKPEPYEDKKKRREEEIAALSESLEALKAQISGGHGSSLLQLSRGSQRRHARIVGKLTQG